MKNSSLFTLLIAVVIVGSITADRNGIYRRGGLLGSGGVLGTGIGKDRPHDYYSTQPSVLQRTGNVAEDVVEGVADTTKEVVEDITTPSYKQYTTDPYRRGYIVTEPYRQEPRFVRQYDDGSYRILPVGK